MMTLTEEKIDWIMRVLLLQTQRPGPPEDFENRVKLITEARSILLKKKGGGE
jgi:hypothetical protein